MSDSVRPHRWQPPRLPCPWDSPGKNTGVGCHFRLQCMKRKRESEVVAQSCPTLSDTWTAATGLTLKETSKVSFQREVRGWNCKRNRRVMERLNPWVNLNSLLQHLRIMFYVLKIGRMEICDNYSTEDRNTNNGIKILQDS